MIIVKLCCNDKHGNSDGLVAAEFGERFASNPHLYLEGDMLSGDPISFRSGWMTLVTGKENHHFCALLRRRWVGNIHWDHVTMADAEAVRLLNWLRSLRHWQVVEATEDLCSMWRSGEAYTIEDLAPRGLGGEG